MPEPTYRIVRCYADRYPPRRTLSRGLTLEEAKRHCDDVENSSKGTGTKARRVTRRVGEWFDAFYKE